MITKSSPRLYDGVWYIKIPDPALPFGLKDLQGSGGDDRAIALEKTTN
jgi:hypothetical protein